MLAEVTHLAQPRSLIFGFGSHIQPLIERSPDHFRAGWQVSFCTPPIINRVNHITWKAERQRFGVFLWGSHIKPFAF
jgi:hypothetical protein